MKPVDTFLKIGEASILLRVTVSTLYSWVHRERIPYRKHGRLLVFSRNELMDWSEQNKSGVTNERVLSLDEIRGKCYNSRPKAGSLKTEYSNQRVKQSTHYDPFIEKESS